MGVPPVEAGRDHHNRTDRSPDDATSPNGADDGVKAATINAGTARAGEANGTVDETAGAVEAVATVVGGDAGSVAGGAG
ncbi:hypothetical protein [Desertimonas flava]|uniref:hypothetical protein n=1 Tax=Desertimonas flava TaxID=2064846 RepID=UPI001D0C1BB9|nr:hypothetical protein [Desertimonas flava]